MRLKGKFIYDKVDYVVKLAEIIKKSKIGKNEYITVKVIISSDTDFFCSGQIVTFSAGHILNNYKIISKDEAIALIV